MLNASQSATKRAAFCDAYLDHNGYLEPPSITAQAMMVAWGLAQTDNQRARASERLSQLVRANAFRIVLRNLTAIDAERVVAASDRVRKIS